jgi:GntR family transcriptional regulator
MKRRDASKPVPGGCASGVPELVALMPLDKGNVVLDCMHTIIHSAPPMLRLHIDNNGVPIYVQIREQLLRAIGAGTLRPGEQLPTMRELAVQLKVDLNTVRHAYDELEETGAIVIVRARGTYVAEKPPPLDGARQLKKIQALAQQAVALAASAGIDPVEVAQEMLQFTKRDGAKR